MSTGDGWWKEFFRGVALDCWELAVPEQLTQTEADFLFGALGVSGGAKVLDVPCGYGRLSLALAEHGLRVTGVDLADEYIARARTRASEKQLPAEFHQGDMRELPWENTFDGGFCFGNSFAYFDDAGNSAFLRAVARALKPGATFVLDYPLTAESIFAHLVERTWIQLGTLYFLAQRQYDPARSVLRSDYTFLRDGSVDCRSAFYRVYMLRELLALCEEAGFGEPNTFAGFDRQPFALGSPRLLLTVRKKENSSSAIR
ncbi:MAG TPA: class I SAM-dependent methyltransferase [Gemmataceae bacterium]|nr:class I SAM-dependent methyltransferase [Gemmataceae bacterium]